MQRGAKQWIRPIFPSQGPVRHVPASIEKTASGKMGKDQVLSIPEVFEKFRLNAWRLYGEGR
jgi:hypothetical protein